jgi:drug/metabolite transporter (DMT)-like permease
MPPALGILGAVAAALCYGVASVLQSVAARRAPIGDYLDPRLLVRLARQLPYLIGITLDLLGFLASVIALRTLPLFFVQAVVSSSVGVTALLAVAVLHHHLVRSEMIALAALGVGLLLLAVSAQAESASPVSTAGGWLLLSGVVVVICLGAIAARSHGPATAPTLAVAAGLAFAGVGIAARALAIPQPLWRLVYEPLGWAVVAYGALGMLLFAAALQRGPVTTASAITFAVETVVPAVVGVVMLGDRPRPDFGVLAIIGFATAVVGTVALARHPASSSEIEPDRAD